MLLAFVLAALLPPSVADDEADLRAVVEKVFAAVKAKDAQAVFSAWSEESPFRAQFEVDLEEAIERPSSSPPSDLQVRLVEREEDAALVRVSFKGKWSKAEEYWTDEPRTEWLVAFQKEKGGWKWFLQAHATDKLASDLATAAPKDRRAILEKNREQVTARLIDRLRTQVDAQFFAGAPEMAKAFGEAAVEAADFTGRKELQAKASLALGAYLMNLEKPGEALPTLTRARDLAVESKEREVEAFARAQRGFALMDSNAVEAALEELGRSLAIAKQHHFEDATFLALLFTGMAHERKGAFPESIKLFEQALGFAVLKRRKDQQAQALDGLSRVRWQTSDYGNALSAARLGAALAEEPDDVVVRAKLLNTAGLVYIASADGEAARKVLEEAFELYTHLKFDRLAGAVQNNIGQSYALEQRYSKAAEAYESAMKVLEKAGDLPVAAIARNNLGLMLLYDRNPDGAMTHFQASYDYAKTLPSKAAAVVPLTNLATVWLARDRHDEALKLLEEAVTLADEHGTPFDRFIAHLGVGRVCEDRGRLPDLDRAIDEFGKAAALLETSRSGLLDAQLQQGFFSQHAALYAALSNTYLRKYRRVEAFAASERGKGRTLVDLLGKGDVRLSKSMTDEERAEEDRLARSMDALSRKLETTRLTDAREELEKEIAKLRASLEEFRRDIAVRHPELETLRGRFAPATLEEIQRTVLAGSPSTAVVSYLLRSQMVLIFVLLPRSDAADLKWKRIEVPLKTVEDDVAEFRKRCSSAGTDVSGPARGLYAVLLKEVAGFLKDVKHLVIVPDGVLHGLPFHALQDATGRCVIETWSVSYAPSVTALVKMSELAAKRRADPPAERTPLLAVGSPAMPAGFTDLPRAQQEAETIAKSFKVAALTGAQATKSAVTKAMASARLILVATHGRVEPERPLYSYVVLAADGDNDGLLRAREIADLDLRADLVVLSACETGLGRQVHGEGVVGLSWALFSAGAPSSIVSLWQVADDATGDLMTRLFEGIGPAFPRPAGAPTTAAALQDAQLRLLRDGKHEHPYYWAPFILVGQPR